MSIDGICPLDEHRYGSAAMRELFSKRGRYRLYVEVEIALSLALAELGIIPESAAQQMRALSEEGLSLSRVEELERETRHEIAAVVKALTERCGAAGRWVHYGATSSDILDTTMAVQFDRALTLLLAKFDALQATLIELAERHLDTILIGRTHGQHALPTTFGFKVANWIDELERHVGRLRDSRERICVGKMSGAVGTLAGFGARGRDIEARVMGRLGIRAGLISTQIVHRDRAAEWACNAAMLAGTLETMATEVRNLQRTEIAELREPFGRERQVGSSTMPHKRNPVLAENVCSIARLLRGLLIPTLENMVHWHERDLANSANERFTVPMTAMLLEEMLGKSQTIFSGLEVDIDRMRSNLESSSSAFIAEAVMLALVDAGLPRLEAYERMRTLSHAKEDFRTALRREPSVAQLIEPAQLESLLQPQAYLGAARERVTLVLEAARRRLTASELHRKP
ncbi:MAG TPA: adenylosuccinate lyase [Pseudomonadota bacterium]|nr:adenylosuccinate lyase [Pseudomonadota bacterium]